MMIVVLMMLVYGYVSSTLSYNTTDAVLIDMHTCFPDLTLQRHAINLCSHQWHNHVRVLDINTRVITASLIS